MSQHYQINSIFIGLTGTGIIAEKQCVTNSKCGIKKHNLVNLKWCSNISHPKIRSHRVKCALNACLYSPSHNDSLTMGTTIVAIESTNVANNHSVFIGDKRYYLWFKRLSVVMWLIDSYLLRRTEMRNSRDTRSQTLFNSQPEAFSCDWRNVHKTIEMQSCRLRINSHCSFDWWLSLQFISFQIAHS